MPSSTSKDQDFGKKFARLQEIVDFFEGDVDDIEKSLELFEEGVEISQDLKKYLDNAKNKVEKIKASFDE